MHPEKNIFNSTMKKVILTFAFLSMLMTGGSVFAQSEGFDGFFISSTESHRVDVDNPMGKMPILPTTHGAERDFTSEAPVGSGLFLLGVMGMGYLAIRKRD